MKNEMKKIEVVKEGFRNYVAMVNGQKVEWTRTYNPTLAKIKYLSFAKELSEK